MADNIGSIAVALICLVWLMLRGGKPSPLAFPALYFMYFAYGPALAYRMGGQIYIGTVVDTIPEALQGFSFALLGWVTADIVWSLRGGNRDADLQAVEHGFSETSVWSSWTYNLVALLCVAYGLIIGLQVLASGGGVNKGAAIESAGPYHYQYLLIMSMVLVWTLPVWQAGRRRLRWLLVAAWMVFIFYCLLTAERDFILVAYAVAVHVFLRKGTWKSGLLLGGLGLTAIFLGSAIFARRAEDAMTVESVLNQGSVLFIDTFMHNLIASGGAYPSSTWIDALIHRTPTEYGTLSQWFVVQYTRSTKGGSGYGFSLTAEGYMIAGFFGVFLLFFILGMIQLWLVKRGRTSVLWAGCSVGFMYTMTYSIRGELYALVSASIQMVALALFFRLGHVVRTRARPSPVQYPLGGRYR